MTDRAEDERRLSPVTLLQRVAVGVPALFFLLTPVFRNPGGAAMFNVVLAALYSVVVLPWIVVRYLRFRYQITPEEIVIRSGVITTVRRNIPIDRVQNVEIEQGMLQRLTRTASVQIFTAGSPQAEGVLDVVSIREAVRIRAVVKEFQAQGLRASGPAVERPELPAPDVATPVQDEGRLVFQMDLRSVLLSGVFRFSLLYIALFFSGLQYFEPDPERMFDWVTGGRFEGLAETAAQSPWMAGMVGVSLAVLFGWLSGIVVNLNRYHGFVLTAAENKLHYRHGLITRRSGTIPLSKVQALIVRTSPLMRRFGWYRLEVQTMGSDVKSGGHKLAVPFGRLEDVQRAADRIQLGMSGASQSGVVIPDTFEPVSRLTIRRAAVRYSVAIGTVAVSVGWFWTPGLFLLLLLPIGLFGAFVRYRNMGYLEGDRWLFVRRGFLKQYTWLVPMERGQVFYTTASVFQRRLDLATVYIDTAGANTIRAADIIDLPLEVAKALTARVYNRFQELSHELSHELSRDINPA